MFPPVTDLFLEVKVTNKLAFSGTSIHFHGIRRLNTPHMDGVNGITQCPIVPGDSFTYKFRAMQYGSSWYHSHYSLQYGDGMLGSLITYGPATADYDSDEAFKPILMTDWNHRFVFEVCLRSF
jgi:FtsP/CotA-like multicopper oxidase with cupredoxin domain